MDPSCSTAAIQTTCGAPIQRDGLVNLSVCDVQVQAPIGVAARVCAVSAAALVGDLRDGAAICPAAGDAVARINR